MEQSTGRPPSPWEDSAEMERLRGRNEGAYRSAVHGWAVEHARRAHDLSPDEAEDVAASVLCEVLPAAMARLTWQVLRRDLEGRVGQEVGRRRREHLYGSDELMTIMELIRQGARKVDRDFAEDAVQNVFLRIQNKAWYGDGDGKPAAYYRRAGFYAALDLQEEQRRIGVDTEDSDALDARLYRRHFVAGSAEKASDADAMLAEYLSAELKAAEEDARRTDVVRLQARNRLAELQAAEPYCLYHPSTCARDADLLADCSSAVAALVSLEAYWRILDPYLERYRVLTRDRSTFARKVRRCAEWRVYTLFRETAADDAHREGNPEGARDQDPLRWQLVAGWALDANGDWNSQYAPKRQVQELIKNDPFMTPLLIQQKPDVAAFLGLTAGTDPSGATR